MKTIFYSIYLYLFTDSKFYNSFMLPILPVMASFVKFKQNACIFSQILKLNIY